MGGGHPAPGDNGGGGLGCLTDGWIDYIIAAYGVGRFLADIDAARDFRGRGGIFGAVLDHASTDGFRALMERHGFDRHDTALAYRQRYLIALLKGSTDVH